MTSSRIITGSLACAFLIVGVSVASAADEWGTLKGQFLFDGTAPKAMKVDTTKEPLCKAHDIKEEKLVVGADGGIKDVIVFCRTKDVKVNPELLKDAKGNVVLDNKDCRFEPHILPMLVTQTLVVKNSDPFSHNSRITELGGKGGANPIIVPAAEAKYNYGKESNFPVPVECNIHPWMKALVLPRSNPYFAVSKADGTFEIKDLPVGKKLEFQVWQEKAGTFKDDKSNGWTNGKFEYTIKPGDNDLGKIKLKSTVFK